MPAATRLVQTLIASERDQTHMPQTSLCPSLRKGVFTVANLISISYYSLVILGSILIWPGSEISPSLLEP